MKQEFQRGMDRLICVYHVYITHTCLRQFTLTVPQYTTHIQISETATLSLTVLKICKVKDCVSCPPINQIITDKGMQILMFTNNSSEKSSPAHDASLFL